MQELNLTEVEQVNGGIIPAVVWKVGFWAAGAAFGAGTVLAVKYLSK